MKECEGKVIIKCLPNNCDFLFYTVSVTNSKDEMVYHGRTSKKGIAEFQISTCDKYKVRVESPECMSPKAASRWVSLNPYETCALYFVFSRDLFKPDYKNATFYLTDQKYIGLPISKGELYLCPNLM